ncbi:MgtC/SapB family protein [Paracoccus beibuensis]|uniref:MgtC/SapB family protein n=1 Tax=Paracoccus beibuensis TaxID=547602 RepID=UPI00223E93B7|nr:MgtC/SapB family protein [Paracoccus beibuensis]
MQDLLSQTFQPLHSMSLATATARLVLALILGALIGWERESSDHEAGLRTHMMISMAAALFTVIAMELTHMRADSDATLQIDPLRLIEAVTSGVAFLAAGSIIITRGSVRGLTTGASMWLAGAIGLSCGTGKGMLAVIAAAFGLMVLRLLRSLARHKRSQATDGK